MIQPYRVPSEKTEDSPSRKGLSLRTRIWNNPVLPGVTTILIPTVTVGLLYLLGTVTYFPNAGDSLLSDPGLAAILVRGLFIVVFGVFFLGLLCLIPLGLARLYKIVRGEMVDHALSKMSFEEIDGLSSNEADLLYRRAHSNGVIIEHKTSWKLKEKAELASIQDPFKV